MKLFVATFESRHFDFEGVGTSARKAVDVLLQGLRAHAKATGIPADWFLSGPHQSESEFIAERIREARGLEAGTSYRDGAEFPPPKVPAPAPVVQICANCKTEHELGEEADSTWMQWQCACCTGWNSWSADAYEAKALAICKAQPGYGTPAYRGDPMDAVALRQEAARARAYTSDDILERYDAGEIDDTAALAELQDRGWTQRRAVEILEDHKAS